MSEIADDAAFFSQWAWSQRTSSKRERARGSHAGSVVEASWIVGLLPVGNFDFDRVPGFLLGLEPHRDPRAPAGE